MTAEQDGARSGGWLVLIGVVILVGALALGFSLYGTLRDAVPHAARTAHATVVTVESGFTQPGVASSGVASHITLTPSASSAAAANGPSVKVEHGAVRFYFAQGKAQLADGADEALAQIVKGVAAGKTAVISVYRAATGSRGEQDAELARDRALAVRNVLMTLGIGADKLVLRGVAESITASTDVEAERVEVTLESSILQR